MYARRVKNFVNITVSHQSLTTFKINAFFFWFYTELQDDGVSMTKALKSRTFYMIHGMRHVPRPKGKMRQPGLAFENHAQGSS